MKLIRVNSARYRQRSDTASRRAKLIKSESGSTDIPPSKDFKFFPFNNKYLKYIGIVVALLLLGLTIIIPISVFITQTNDSSTETTTLGTTEYPGNSTIPSKVPLGKHLMIFREGWGGRPSKNFTKPLNHPTLIVLISHTVTDFCTTIESCSQIVRSAQDYHVGHLQSPDVGYNFLIGGDSNAYVGRGWDIRNFHMDNCIGISFIGNFLYDELTEGMIETSQNLLQLGLEERKLSIDYKVIAHNQTYNTESPGQNIYKVIKNWAHFDSTYSRR